MCTECLIQPQPPGILRLGGPLSPHPPHPMPSWSLTYVAAALIAALLGFSGILGLSHLAGAAAGLSRVGFFLFLALSIVSLFRSHKSA